MFGNKGQFFLITALIFVIYFSVLFSSSLSYETTIESRKYLEFYIYSDYFENFKSELGKIFTYFYDNSSMKNFVKNFTIYARDKFDLKDMGLREIFLLASYDTIQANQEQILSISLLNLLNKGISNINITFNYNNTSRTQSSLEDSNFFETFFGFNIASDSTYKLILKYNDGENQSYEIDVPLKIVKSKKIGFWVVSLKIDGSLIKDTFENVG